MAAVSRRLADYLAWAGRQEFEYGRWDCLIGLVAEWLRRERGGDPAAPWRGRYTTEMGCARLLAREGGLLALMERGLGLAGLEATHTPRTGDIGAVDLPTRRGPAPMGAICTGRAWAVLTPRGIALVRGDPLMVWRI